MLRVGIVAEGSSDWIVLEEVMKTVHHDIEFERLQPDYTLVSRFPFGWRGVKAWCVENGPRLELLMRGVPGRPLHLLVIHADCSMADKAGVEHPCPPAANTASALSRLIDTEWLGRDPRPDFLLVATPSKSSDAWVVATFDPPFANLAAIECDKAVEEEFVRRGLLKRKKGGHPKKQTQVYAKIAAHIGPSVDSLCFHCPQAEVFRSNFMTAVARLPTP